MGLLEAERGVSTLGQQMHFTYELDLVIEAARAMAARMTAQIRQRIAQAWSGPARDALQRAAHAVGR